MTDIDIRIGRLEQLLDSLDPAPFHDKALDANAERYLVECAEELSGERELRIVVHVPEPVKAHAGAIEQAIHAHFEREHALLHRRYGLRMRLGRRALVIAIAVLVAALLLREALQPLLSTMRLGAVLGEGLLILGWVALWRPVEMLLYERYELRHRHDAVARLATMPVLVVRDEAKPA